MEIGIVVGNPNPKSRTRTLAEAVGDEVGAIVGETGRFVVDLIDVATELFDWHSSEVNALAQRVARADFLVIASPTYKATYTGLLKAFLDRYDTNGLEGTVAIPVMTGGAPVHGLAPEMGLRSLLVELGASVPTRSLFFLTEQMDQLPSVVASWAQTNRNALAGAAFARRDAIGNEQESES